jgi:ubiquinone/menaquinone biosynthesis C-methylase UbiE
MTERDYVLGTHDEELHRLGLQHRVWRPRALDAWRRAQFTAGQTLLDAGCGPGYAALDLASIAGPTGRVVAVDRSARYLEALQQAARNDGIEHISTYERDLDRDPLPDVRADGAFVRWVFAFLTRPRDLLQRVLGTLRPGGTLVVYEYFDYRTWRFAGRAPLFEEFVTAVMKSWRSVGGEPDIGLALPAWIEEEGAEVVSLQTITHVISPADEMWQWPKTFVEVGLQRLVELGELDARRADAIRDEFAAAEAAPHARMVTPGVLEILARKRD